jgi:hypothetical protein
MSTTHHYLEVGAVQMEQDDPVSKDGTGGNRRQSYPTGWWAWPQGSQPTGGSTLPSLPYEVACAVSLTSDVRGPRGKGRFYLPPFSTNFVGAAPGGLWDADTPASVGGAIGAWIQAVETATGHQALIVSGRAKQLHPVRAVLVGKVPDSQRRRRRSLDEARVTGWTRP